ncbi:T9SS type A sorting domain-containing protein [Chryseolinea sp. H1M3-3]|uniref:PKD domain-containing protein n=1 Tax=Chryseolinea sp. H1M3-3 TaxID=3034144 RepID=UPI0023EB0C98|nr:T9SS type A sorting domain-containing protein [Chryseolinea sp. H1M3-3]
MKSFLRRLLSTVLVGSLASLSLDSLAQVPVWPSGYPSSVPSYSDPVTNGVYQSNVRVRVRTDQPGWAYFVTYQTPPPTAPSADDIVRYARGTLSAPSGMVGKDSIGIGTANTTYTKDVPNLAQNASGYTTYVVARSTAGVASIVKSTLCRLKLKGKRIASSYFYLEYLPADYNNNSNSYPLMIFLHGAGERGNSIGSLGNVITHGPPKEITAGKDLPFIIISPQLPTGTFWDSNLANVDAFVEAIKAAYPRIDLNRVYLTGLSMGGYGTWKYAQRNPEKFAAIAPISGGGNVSQACVLEDMPIWALHDDPDDVVPTSNTTNMENAITNCAGYTGKMRVTLYRNKNSDGSPRDVHAGWSRAYGTTNNSISPESTATLEVVERPGPVPDDMTLYSWLLQYSLGNNPPVANAGTDITFTPPPNSRTLTGTGSDSDGTIVSYLWTQQNGPNQATIQNGSTPSPTVSNLITGTYTFRLTVTDNDGLPATDDVNVVVQAPGQVVWNSYNIVMQSNPAQQGLVTSNNNAVQATVEFYQSTNDFGVDKGNLFTTFTPANHTNSNSAATNYWANGTGNVYPYAAKSTQGRGLEPGEGNVQPPTGVFDLQLHPPNTNKLTVCAFVVPSSGNYTLSGLAARRVLTQSGTALYKVFDQNKVLLTTIQVTPDQDWVTDSNSYSLGTLAAGDRIYFATDREGNYAYDFTEVSWSVAMEPTTVTQTWNSYDLVMQSSPSQQAVVNSDNSVQATLEFYQSTNDFGVDKGTLFTTFTPSNHTNSNSAATNYWANGTGNVYPYAAKSTQGRGLEPGEGNVQPPTGVFDLQLHPPNNNKLTVCAFVVPSSGDYTISGLAARRVLTQAGTTLYKVFDQNKVLVTSIQVTPDQDWVTDPNSYSLGTLTAGDRIYFATDREGNYAYDFTEVAWTITSTAGGSMAMGRLAFETPEQTDKVAENGEREITLYPNRVKDEINISGIKTEAEIQIYDLSGKNIVRQQLTSTDGTVNIQAPMLQPGMYYMVIQTNGSIVHKKFQKE